MPDNLQAFLDTIAWSEGTTRIPGSDNGYNVLVGSTPTYPLFFTSYKTHPDKYNPLLNSTAAGRYQIIFPTWSCLCARLGINDFSPATQDAMATSLIMQDCAAGEAIAAGYFIDAVAACSSEWASLPGSTAGQFENTIAALQAVYKAAGGTLAT